MICRNSRKTLAWLAGFRRAEDGTVAVEFAVAAPVLLILLSGMVDLGLALDQSSSLSNAARAGAQYAIRFPSDTSGITQVVAKAMNADPSDLTVNANLSCECPGGSAVACTDVCSGASPKSYMTVSVSMPYTSPLPTGLIFGVTSLSSSAVFRVN